MSPHPNVFLFKKLTPTEIRVLLRTQVVLKLGLKQSLSSEQLQECEWPIGLLQERLLFLNEKQAHAKTTTLADDRRITIQNQEIIITNFESQRRCNKCFFLERNRPLELFYAVFLSLLVSVITTALSTASTPLQVVAKIQILSTYGAFLAIAVLLIIIWVIAKCCCRPHPHT